jgi:hypothetical protein
MDEFENNITQYACGCLVTQLVTVLAAEANRSRQILKHTSKDDDFIAGGGELILYHEATLNFAMELKMLLKNFLASKNEIAESDLNEWDYELWINNKEREDEEL